jgi:hypothetical protein
VPLEELVARERKSGRQAKYDEHYAKGVMNDRKMKEGKDYDSDDEYGEGGTAYKKWDEKKSRKQGKVRMRSIAPLPAALGAAFGDIAPLCRTTSGSGAAPSTSPSACPRR